MVELFGVVADRFEPTWYVFKYNDEYYLKTDYKEKEFQYMKIGKEIAIYADKVLIRKPDSIDKAIAERYKKDIIEFAKTDPKPLYKTGYTEDELKHWGLR